MTPSPSGELSRTIDRCICREDDAAALVAHAAIRGEYREAHLWLEFAETWRLLRAVGEALVFDCGGSDA